ncbi:MAG: ATP-dependent helicase [Pyrinomonadaceae bacterium]
MPWDDGLAGSARDIAGTHDSPLRVMAGPGTGKSFVMKRRVARLLEEGVDPRRILAVTFTRNAAASLIEDLNDLGVDGSDRIRAGTLHSFCFALLGQQDVFDYLGRVPRPVVTFTKSGVLQFEGRSMLDDLIIAGVFGPKRECTRRIRAFEAAWARLQSETPGWPQDPVDRQFHATLLAWLQFHQAMLIGELVPETLRFLRNNPASDALRAFDHVIVDEYQDLNRAEQDLIDLMANHGATAIVGDVDQSIYRFRYANPEGIESFDQTHPHTHDESLDICRRCSRRVVTIADYLIRQNHPGSPDPRLRPKPDNPAGELHIIQWPTLDEEMQGLSEYVRSLIANRGYRPGDILVLTPRRLIGYGIRDQLAGGVAVHSFYHEEALEAEQAQQAFAMLCLLANREDRVALRWSLGQGSPSGRREAYRRLREYCEASGSSPWETLTALDANTLQIPNTGQLVAKFRQLRTTLDRLQALDLAATVEELLPAHIGEVRALREAALLAIPRTGTVGQLFDFLKTAVTQPEMPEEGDYVRVMSLHKSKGLTTKVAIVAGCIQGLIPFQDFDQPIQEQQAILAEQRRLFYVAITRCTEILVLSSAIQLERDLAWRIGAQVRRGGGPLANAIASRFLQELGTGAPQPLLGANWRDANYA